MFMSHLGVINIKCCSAIACLIPVLTYIIKYHLVLASKYLALNESM